MKLKDLFSSQALRQQLALSFRRFPVPIIFLSAACLLAIVNKIEPFIEPVYAISWAGALGVLSTLAINLWCELLKTSRRQKALLIIAGSIAVADFFYIVARGGSWSNAEFLAQSALITSLIVAVVFPPVAKNYNRKSIFTFTLEQIRAGIASLALCLILWIAACIILGTIALLFHYDSSTLWYCIVIISAVWIPVLFYFTQIPCIDTTGEYDTALHRTVGNATIYVLLPLVAIYTLILYIYGLKILITWELPTDSLSTMVSGLLCVSLITIYGLQSFTLYGASDRRSSISQRVSLWLPVMLIPLLVLMTVGLCYRMNEYGITISRLYLATFVVWAYIVVIYLVIKAGKAHLNRIAASFAIIFVLVSVFPRFNYSDLTLSYMQRAVRTSLGDLHYPVSLETIKERIKAMPEDEAEQTASRIDYLYDYASAKEFSELTTSDEYITIDKLLSVKEEEVILPNIIFEVNDPVNIPEGYRTVRRNWVGYNTWASYDSISPDLIKINDDSIEYFINPDSLLLKASSDPQTPIKVRVTSPRDTAAIFIITDATIERDKDRTIRHFAGYLFEH